MWKQNVDKLTTVQQQPLASISPVVAEAGKRSAASPMGQIGTSVVIKGNVTAAEDLTIAGRVEGTIELRDHALLVAPGAHLMAEVTGKIVVVAGSITGNITASEKIEVRETGSVEGDVRAPRIVIAEGAQFRGRLEMQTPKDHKSETAAAKRPSVAV